MAQIRALVAEGVDLLIVSPNQSHTITPAIEEAFDAGVPVILFDRKIDSDRPPSGTRALRRRWRRIPAWNWSLPTTGTGCRKAALA